jgi:hypothetical protein
MDNYVKDSKNRHLLAFLWLLTTRDVFKEAKLALEEKHVFSTAFCD